MNAGHFSPNNKWTNEVWGLAMCSDGDTFVTCSDDATVRKFNMKKRMQERVGRTFDRNIWFNKG